MSELGESNNNGKILLYIDNSNIFISTQVHSGKVKNFMPGIFDSNCRLKMEQLIDIVVDGRNVHVQRAYGKIPQEVSDVLKRKGVEVRNCRSSSQNPREKEADSQLTADAVEDIITKKPQIGNPNNDTIVLLSGDQDMCPMIQKARKYGWNVEIWSYEESSLAFGIKTERERKVNGTIVTIKDLGKPEIFEKFAISEHQDWKINIPPDRTLVVTFVNGARWINELDFEIRKGIEEEIGKLGVKIFRLPIATKFCPSGKDVCWALVVTISEKGKKYDFHKDVWSRHEEFRNSFAQFMKRRFGIVENSILRVEKYLDNPLSKPHLAPTSTNSADQERSAAGTVVGRAGGAKQIIQCRFYPMGKCTKGFDCPFSHLLS